MANPEHIALILAGRERWNEWRNHSKIRPDLRQAPLSRISLAGYNLPAPIVTAPYLSNQIYPAAASAALMSAHRIFVAPWLAELELSNASFHGANLSQLDLSGITMDTTNFSQAIVQNARFNNSKLRFCRFEQADLRDADFSSSTLENIDFRNVDLRGANFYKAKLDGADLTDAWIWNIRATDWELSKITAPVVKTGQHGEKDQFALGQFERIFATRTLKVHLPTSETPFEISNLSNLLHLLGSMRGAFSVTFDEAEGNDLRTAAIKIEPRSGADAIEVEELNDVIKGLHLTLDDSNLALENERKKVAALNSKLLEYLMSVSPAGGTGNQQELESLTVTVADMTGSSKFSEEENSRRTTKFWGVGLALVMQMGARHVNTWGDSLIACFPDTQLALDSAWELIMALSKIDIQCRAGVHHGPVRVQFNPVIGRHDILGATVHLAARLEPEADPGSLLVSEEVRAIALARRIEHFHFQKKEIIFGKAAGKFAKGDKYVASIALRKSRSQ